MLCRALASGCIAALLGSCAAPVPVTLRDPARDGERVYELRVCRANGRTCDDIGARGLPAEECTYVETLTAEGAPAIGDLEDEPYLFLAFARDPQTCALRATACEHVEGRGRDPVELSLAPAEGVACVPSTACACDEIVDVSAGGDHTCAVVADARVYCWGRNDWGQLGIEPAGTAGTAPAARTEPVRVPGLDDFDAVDVEAGAYHTCARNTAGSVRCWGSHEVGQLGHGAPPSTTARSATPVAVLGVGGAGTLDDAEELAAGYRFTCARLRDGDVACWGYNEGHQLGRGESAPRVALPTPDLVVDLDDARTIVAGIGHACAVHGEARALACWGWNRAGAIGTGVEWSEEASDDGVPFYARPVSPEPPLAGVVDVAAGGWEEEQVNYIRDIRISLSGHTCAIDASGASCWGRDHFGQLGRGEIVFWEEPSPRPVQTAMQLGRITAGSYHTCALTADQMYVACWGSNEHGQIGREGGLAVAPEGIEAPPWPLAIDQIDAGRNHTCVRADGRVWCWGSNEYGQLGAGTLGEDRTAPVDVLLPDSP